MNWTQEQVEMIRGKLEEFNGKVPEDVQEAMAKQLGRTKSAVYQRIRIEARIKAGSYPTKAEGSVGTDGNTYMLAKG